MDGASSSSLPFLSDPTMVGPSIDNQELSRKRHPLLRSSSSIKFLCSYGGKILPRYPDGKLRYHGGETRLIAVKKTISFAELLSKMRGLCATTVSVRCQLPTEDIDSLLSVSSDMDLANLMEEYSHATAVPSGLQIRAFLSLPTKKNCPPPSHPTRIGVCPKFRMSFLRSIKKSGVKMPLHIGYGNRMGNGGE